MSELSVDLVVQDEKIDRLITKIKELKEITSDFNVQLLSLRPGDLLILTTPGVLKLEAYRNIVDSIGCLGIKCVVFEGGLKPDSVVRFDE